MTAASAPITGRKVFFWMTAFFAVVTAVNAVFITLAVTTFPGEDVKRSYYQGLRFNEELAERAAGRALNWAVEAGYADGAVTVRVTGADGEAPAGLSVSGVLRRPVEDGHDVALSFTAQGGGVFTARAENLLPGQYELRATAATEDGRSLDFTRRLWPHTAQN